MRGSIRTCRLLGNFGDAGVLSGVDLARNLNGTSDFITLPFGVTDAVANGSAMSIACWFNGSNAQSSIRLESTDGQYLILNWSATIMGSGACIMVNDGQTTNGLTWPTTVVDGNWHHLAMSWRQNATFAIYFDGSLYTSRAAANSALPSFSPHQYQPMFGQAPNAPGSEFTQGSLADVAIWTVALNSTEISNLASGKRANTIGANANFVGYWPMIGQSPEPDKSGNGFDGVLTGTTVVPGPPQLALF
jgi:hypothetical protein